VSTALLTDLTIFILALLVGIEVIGKVPATLHTPLMSATNAIHGIVLVGALLIGVTAHNAVGYVIAFIAAIGETIPVIGPIIGGVTAVAVALTVSPKLALTVGTYFLVLHQLEANILVPKIMERRVGVSPVAVIVALLIGGELYGLVGAILAIPTAAILSVIVEEAAVSHEVRIQRVR